MATEHVCITCPQLRQGDPRVYERANVCNGCRARLQSMLGDIWNGYQQLAGELMPGQGRGERVSGSREAPLPLRVDPLDLTMPARFAAVHDVRGDQLGYVSVATVLDSWVRDWRDTLRPQQALPRPSVRHLTIWLTHRLDDACDRHSAIDEFAAEMRDLLSAIWRVTGATEVKPEYMDGVVCRRCDLKDLYRLPGQDRVECQSCGDLLTEEEYRRWTRLLAVDLTEVVG